LELLPFPLTGAQQRVLAEIRADLEREQPMARLVQGDVGSGKTVVAIASLLTAIEAGCQGALMAPTEVLAEQHYRKLCEWLPQLHVSCALLTGSTPARRRRELLADLANGTLKMLVGTHALLEDPVQFARLGLVVVDEQHRFGVHQRNRLLDKGLQPHLLTMTATPIPRTLALSLHGDLEVSQIDELPPGRTPICTALLSGGERDQAYQLIREQVALGQRAYVVLPLVEESEKLDLRSAVEVHQQLSTQIFPDLQVGLLHGRMPSPEKQAAIGAFAAGDTQVLVSTTVVEVGVDVPEASVMVIEHADRFGLAQLHQLRGRVGRGAAASYCQLINDSRNALARQRLEVLVHSTDGFEIAEMDLRLRGPGQVLGTRQSGLPDLALASLTDDGDVLEQARRVAQQIMESDPSLEAHAGLAAALAEQRQRTAAPARLN
jgi:ATP-dependent DNA helicase RecG